MKRLDLNDNIEKALISIIDAALKHPQLGGLQMNQIVNSVIAAVQSDQPAITPTVVDA